ncbi:MAG: class I tRNA ligase family protein, partial [Gammaproteobacteria bacterium]|nr:class I tRNA ligase family protein [Gammaproteobacteria bacterium]
MRAYDFHELERRWRAAWERSHCHQAPEAPVGPKYFIHDAAPFPNGPLHLGHVRTYLLGDVMARYQRLRGRCVLYLTGFDAFGLPIELAAEEAGLSPPQLVAQCIGLMTRQLKELGISYDWSRVPRTCDPDCYRWTQWLFLELLEAGLIERRTARLHWCPRCRTTLARIQVEDEGCWRCGSRVTQRAFPQWFVAISHYSDRLHRTVEDLDQWSNRSKRMLRGFFDTNGRADRSHGNRAHEWLVSRQRSWGTPIPIVYCACCGVVPVPREDLPVCLPETLDWTNGSGALARCESFRETSCPRCGGSARRETDTLDCFFDDIWCFLQPLVTLGRSPGFTRENLGDWLPVDCAQSGLDTCICFHLYRFLGRFLHDRGLLHDPEPIRRFVGNEMVLAGGRKMSKHFGNAVSPESIVREHGADALRVAMLW